MQKITLCTLILSIIFSPLLSEETKVIASDETAKQTESTTSSDTTSTQVKEEAAKTTEQVNEEPKTTDEMTKELRKDTKELDKEIKKQEETDKVEKQPAGEKIKEVAPASQESLQAAKRSRRGTWLIAGLMVVLTGAGLIALAIHDGKSSH